MIMLFSTHCSGAEVVTTGQAPDRITIDFLANIYQPVFFDHDLHAGYAACVECHHHTAKTSATDPSCYVCHQSGGPKAPSSCRKCHPMNRFIAAYSSPPRHSSSYHIDIPSLKGAYHLNCIDCHEVIGTGPTDCIGCHKSTDKAERFYYTGDYSPPPPSVNEHHHQEKN
jgi:hypothetical protein